MANVLIDRYLTQWDVREHHKITLELSPERAYQAVKDLDLGRSLLIRFLFTVEACHTRTR